MTSAFRVSTSFLNNLKASYPLAKVPPSLTCRNPWALVAAVAFSASNKPEAVPQVFAHALQDIQNGSPEERREYDDVLLAREMREALFKSGMLSGYSKAINSLIALAEVTPEYLKQMDLVRDPKCSLDEYNRIGQSVFESLYGSQSKPVKELLFSAYPDMEWFSTTIAYGLVYGNNSMITPVETAYTLIATLIAADTPRQLKWHLDSAQRCGATLDQVRAVRHIATEVAKLSGVQWQHEIPEVQEIKH